MEFVRWIDVIGKSEHGVFEGEKRSRIDVKLDVQINGSAATVLGVKINFPRLTQGVGLDKMAFIVHVETMGNRVILEVSNKTSNINGGHCYSG